MDIVYIVGAGSQAEDLELKYSIRSLVRHLSGIDKLIIAGHMPSFIKGAIHIPLEDPYPDNRARNIYEKILAACRHKKISQKFVLMSDDYFLLKDFDAATLPYYHIGNLNIAYNGASVSNYYRYHLENTIRALEEKGHETLNYNIHFPMVISKKLFLDIMPTYDWDIKLGYVAKSLYANSVVVTRQLVGRDWKIHTPKTADAIRWVLKDAMFFSTNEHSMNTEMIDFLQERFPVASSWER